MANRRGGLTAENPTFPRSPDDFRENVRVDTLCRLFDEALTHTRSRIIYYDRQGTQKGNAARGIRRFALLFFLLGTLAPLLSAMIFRFGQTFSGTWDRLAKLPVTEIGYAFLAISGGFVLYDQFFGDSQSWMRYRETQVRLELSETRFKYQWASKLAIFRGDTSDMKLVSELTALLVDHVTDIEHIAAAETREWITQFRAQLDAFDQKLKAGQEGSRHSVSTAEGAHSHSLGGDRARPGASTAEPAGQDSVRVRVLVNNRDGIEEGSLKLSLNNATLALDDVGIANAVLRLGRRHHFNARARRGGEAVSGAMEISPTSEDDGKTFALSLNSASSSSRRKRTTDQPPP